ncbi:MAG: pyruvate, phosphate dikinase [Planctomycetes bacterium]|nr:pyruvate, phosphate dikinase [Planctomycetota bacterium]
MVNPQLSLGLPGLDRMIRGLIPGDNLVWEVDSVEDYAPFVRPYCDSAAARGQKVVYFRFASHPPLLEPNGKVEVCQVHPAEGFETFLAEIHKTIERTGRGGFYVFDCLSELAVDWYSDQMLANFFMLTCPYLYDVEAIAYFALLRNYHSSHATAPITETAQVFLDVYRHKGHLYIHPLKVQQRYSPTMYMLHAWEGDDFTPVRESARISEILTSVPWLHPESEHYRVGVWHRTFLRAEETLAAIRAGEAPPGKAGEYFQRLIRMALSRDERVRALVEKHLTLPDILDIGKRMIGTGLVGGKAAGMLLARAILRQQSPRWADVLEPHDSFYIGSDVFYTFLVQNGIWWMRQRQKDAPSHLEGAGRPRQRMLTGRFPDYIMRQFEEMLDYFGQSPIIVRSSSLLEDNFGNSFAGKYESVFCANQGSREKRLQDFLSAVRTIYASTMSEKALSYRAARGILDRDEQMALLVQRVSGSVYGENLFFPQIAGVGLSVNPYAWSEYIDPKAGMLRLVFGLGTRAVERADDDYTRVVALNAPERRPESNFDEVRRYSQHRVDVLDLTANQLVSDRFAAVARRCPELPLALFACGEGGEVRTAGDAGRADAFPWVLTFDRLFAQTPFVQDMRDMLRTLQEAYDYPVDVEFTANFFADGSYKINLVQCRPLQVKGAGPAAGPPPDIRREDVVVEAHGAVIGQSRLLAVDRLIYVEPAVYGQLPVAERYAVARLIGRLAHAGGPGGPRTLMLLGPGRWGTTTPSLGIPVRFADIDAVGVLCEIVAMRDDLVPDVSLGTHFLNELIEMDILYTALFPTRPDNFLNKAFFESRPNRLADLAPDAAAWAAAVRVVDAADLGPAAAVKLYANHLKQTVICYLDRENP